MDAERNYSIVLHQLVHYKRGRFYFCESSSYYKTRISNCNCTNRSSADRNFWIFIYTYNFRSGFLCYGYLPDFGYLNLIYYVLYMFLFLASLALVTSVFTMVARDFQKLLSSLIRLLFYLTPILWDMSDMPSIYQRMVQVSPVYYIVKGFRESMLYHVPFYVHWKEMIIEWVVLVVLFLAGCYLQERFRNRFRDLI